MQPTRLETPHAWTLRSWSRSRLWHAPSPSPFGTGGAALGCGAGRGGRLQGVGAAGRNGAEKCSCYNVLLCSAVGSSVQVRISILFGYRVTPTDRDVARRRLQHSSLVSEKT